MERLIETRGSLRCPAFFQVSLYNLICSACWIWKGLPLSSNFKVELCRCMPFSAAQTAVALEAAPHQIRSRNPSEYGYTRNKPGGFGNIGYGLGWANPLPLSLSKNSKALVRPISVSVSPSLGS